jgi:hypothetical protein
MSSDNNKLALIDSNQYSVMEKLANIATKSGYAGKTEVQAMFVMLKGFELGISPMQALDGITVIQNKTTVSPQLMLALINRSGELADIKITTDATKAEVTMTRRNRSPHTETFTMTNATAMGLAGKDNWKKQPAVMLKWRAVSACARVVFPDVIQGMYTPEEMGAEVSEDDSGNLIIDEPVVEVQTTPEIAPETVLSVEIPTQAPTTQQPAQNTNLTPSSPFGKQLEALPTWFNTATKDCFGALKQYLMKSIYADNAYHMNGSLDKHGITTNKGSKLADKWATKAAKEVVDYLIAERDAAMQAQQDHDEAESVAELGQTA